MKHRKLGRKFGRESHQRSALFRSLATSLVTYERITTTLQKAKDLKRIIEKAITMAMEPGAAKNPRLETFFHSVADRELVGNQEISAYLLGLGSADEKKAMTAYLDDPAKAPKPANVVEYLPVTDKRKGPKILRLKGLMTKLVDEIAPRFKARKEASPSKIGGGYTRIYKLGVRRGDAAEMALIELIKD